MNTVSTNVIEKIKTVLLFFRIPQGFSQPLKRKEPTMNPGNPEFSQDKRRDKEFDLATFQRKAHCGNYFVGPYIFLNPDLFE